MSEKTNEILIPAEFARLFDSDWREAGVYGGRYSLKSHTVARVLLIRAMQKKTRVFCGREYQNSLADSSHQLLSDLIEQYELSGFNVTRDGIVHENGSDFIFKGLRNNIESIKSIEGIDIAWVEEAQVVSTKSLDILSPTVRKPGSQIIYTYNRLRPDDPIHVRLVVEGRPNTLLINVDYKVAIKYGWMSKQVRDEAEDDKKKRPEVFKHKWLGEPATLKGQIYPDWKKIEKIPKEARYLGPGIDFGYTNHPTAVIDVWKWNKAYILDEILYNRGLSNPQIAKTILKLPHYSNQLAVGDSAEPKSIAEIKDEGVNIIGSKKGRDSVNNGIQRMQNLEIYYTATSHNLEEEQLNYAWRVDKEDKSLNIPIDAYNHGMDGARYKIMDIETFKPLEYGGVR